MARWREWRYACLVVQGKHEPCIFFPVEQARITSPPRTE